MERQIGTLALVVFTRKFRESFYVSSLASYETKCRSAVAHTPCVKRVARLAAESGIEAACSDYTKWRLAGTADSDKIRRWWMHNPSYNVGIACGASGLVVLDVDGLEGEESLAELEAECGKNRSVASSTERFIPTE